MTSVEFDERMLGLYWYRKDRNMREYCEFVRGVINTCRSTSRAFAQLQWSPRVGKPIPIEQDCGNLDEVISLGAWYKKQNIIGEWSDAKRPGWSAHSKIGFGLILDTGRSPSQDGLFLGIHSGDPAGWTPGSIVISFSAKTHSDLDDYPSVVRLFSELIRYVSPESGVLTSDKFSDILHPGAPSATGWLSYFADPRCREIASCFQTEAIENGTLFTLGVRNLFSITQETVSEGTRLREGLRKQNIIGNSAGSTS